MGTMDVSSLLASTQNKMGNFDTQVSRLGANNKIAKMSPMQVDKTAQDFESMFVSQMLEQMFGESLGDDLFGDNDTNEVYKGMMMEQYGKEIAKSGGIGIADYVKRELLKLQEV